MLQIEQTKIYTNKEEVTGVLRNFILMSFIICILYLNLMGQLKGGWDDCVMEVKRNADKITVQKPQRNGSYGDLDVDESLILKWIFEWHEGVE